MKEGLESIYGRMITGDKCALNFPTLFLELRKIPWKTSTRKWLDRKSNPASMRERGRGNRLTAKLRQSCNAATICRQIRWKASISWYSPYSWRNTREKFHEGKKQNREFTVQWEVILRLFIFCRTFKSKFYWF